MRQFTNRDLQCDFENEFWDEAECGWKYSQAILALISSPSDTVRMTRVKVTHPANVGTNYWKKDNTYSLGKLSSRSQIKTKICFIYKAAITNKGDAGKNLQHQILRDNYNC